MTTEVPNADPSSDLAIDGTNPTEGDSFDLIFTVTDANPGDTLTVTFSSTAGDSETKVVTSGVQDLQRGCSVRCCDHSVVDDGNGGQQLRLTCRNCQRTQLLTHACIRLGRRRSYSGRRLKL